MSRRSQPWELVSSYVTKTETEHLSERGEQLTLCGRNREAWMVLREANLTKDLDSAYLCRKCRTALLR